MATQMVNLDALIPREDFETVTSEVEVQPSSLSTTMNITHLGQGSLIFSVLRKPDFQRETANWTPEKVAELVKNFLEGDLIPSVILWRSSKTGNIFVIDGAHRLSALIAWVHDDYGDKHTSVRFFENSIPPEQIRAAEATRKLINGSVGSYRELDLALRNSDTAPPDRLRLARNMGVFAINLQWVTGEAEKAESSFFRINQQATVIDPTELDMIKSRRKPNAVATRALIRAGTGHKYWSNFDVEVRDEIERIAKEVYDLIFKPPLEQAIRTSELPVAGRGYSADSVRMVFELVNFVNKLDPAMWRTGSDNQPKKPSSAKSAPSLADDIDGRTTVKYMQAVRRMAGRIAGNEPASLGLHPAVYFYSATGRFQPAAFLATIRFVDELETKRKLQKFTDVRSRFEDFLVEYKYFLNQIVQTYGSLGRSVPPIHEMHQIVFESLLDDIDPVDIVGRLRSSSTLSRSLREITEEDRRFGRNFSAETKNGLILKGILDSATRCGICEARLLYRSITFDHKIRKDDGGLGSPENAQLSHPFCNSGYKESQNATAVDTPAPNDSLF